MTFQRKLEQDSVWFVIQMKNFEFMKFMTLIGWLANTKYIWLVLHLQLLSGENFIKKLKFFILSVKTAKKLSKFNVLKTTFDLIKQLTIEVKILRQDFQKIFYEIFLKIKIETTVLWKCLSSTGIWQPKLEFDFHVFKQFKHPPKFLI